MMFLKKRITRLFFGFIGHFMKLDDIEFKESPYMLHVYCQIFKVLKNISDNENVRNVFLSNKQMNFILGFFDQIANTIKVE